MTTYQLEVIAGLAALSAACLIAAGLGYTHYLWRQQHPARHRAGGEGGSVPLPPSPVEVFRTAMANATLDRERGDRLVVLPNGDVEIDRSASQERTEEVPRVETPVVHVEAAEEPPEDGAIGTLALEESPEMAAAAWQHDWDQRWTALLVGWAQRPDWLTAFSDANLQLPEYRRLVLEHTQDATSATDLAALIAEAKAGAR